MARVLFAQPSFQPPGGGNGVASWMLQALLEEHSVTTLTWRPLDVRPIDRFYGTSLTGRSISRVLVSGLSRALIGAAPTSMALMRSAVLVAEARRLSPDFDLIVSANNEADFGRPSILYVHYPCYRRPRPTVDIRWFHHPLIMLDAYYALADSIADVKPERLRQHLVLTNSDWTGGVYRAVHGGRTTTLYPPVPSAFPRVAWEARENGFVSIGRIAPEKELDRVIDIVAGVRRLHADAHLHIVGTPGEASYYRRLKERIRSLPWVTTHEDVAQSEVIRLISMHRFGLHGMLEEHFGMGPAEMVGGGCLVWVHNAGGQVEVVDRDPRFLYDSVDEAVEKILDVMSDEERRRSASESLGRRRTAFSVDVFTRQFQDHVNDFMERHRRPGFPVAPTRRS